MGSDVMQFAFSDSIAGYVTGFDWEKEAFGLKTGDGRGFEVELSSTTSAELIRNLDEPYHDCTGQMPDMLMPGRFLFAYGIFYPHVGGHIFEAKHLIFLGRTEQEYRFEEPDWWIRQVRSLADFYLRAQFGDGEINFRDYRTKLTLEGTKMPDLRQETDTISRLVYGFASAYLMSGDERYLEAAESGTEYLRQHLRFIDSSQEIVYWYHGVDLKGNHERKIFASEFGDDYDAIPAYEQIYALAGPCLTYRITGDPRILSDIHMTLNLFDRYFLDREKGGYFSHIDPITFDPTSEGLGRNRARKNWNSVGDHAPAYLINAWLATGDDRFAEMLAYVADTIEKRFPDFEHSPFVQERFHEDWSPDREWGWQQDRAVVGHNLKIAWNLMRINQLRPSQRYVELARKIAGLMPAVGVDLQRGGWYDVVERVRQEGERFHRFAWHDRKAWWQQEQAILAYFILAGSLKDPEYLRLAREAAGFYNAMFLDMDSGGVYFNVLAAGIPYLIGTERLKGSHAMAGYHSFELAYLAAVYSNLLVNNHPMELHFKPKPGGFRDNVLRVQPDILPLGSVRIGEVWIDNQPYTDFDPEGLTVRLPTSKESLKVRVRLLPAALAVNFSSDLKMVQGEALLTMAGVLDDAALPVFQAQLQQLIAQQPKRVVILMKGLQSISPAAMRALIFETGKLGVDVDVYAVGTRPTIKEAFKAAEYAEEINLVDDYELPGTQEA